MWCVNEFDVFGYVFFVVYGTFYTSVACFRAIFGSSYSDWIINVYVPGYLASTIYGFANKASFTVDHFTNKKGRGKL
jgi:hypothetical protein